MKLWIAVWIALLLLPIYSPPLAVFLSLCALLVAYILYTDSSSGSPYRRMAYSRYPDEVEVRYARMEHEMSVARGAGRRSTTHIPAITLLVFFIDLLWAILVR